MGKRSGSSSTKRKPPISIQDLHKALHVFPTRNGSGLGKSAKKTSDPNTLNFKERFAKEVDKVKEQQQGYCNVLFVVKLQPRTTNAGNEDINGTTDSINTTEMPGGLTYGNLEKPTLRSEAKNKKP